MNKTWCSSGPPASFLLQRVSASMFADTDYRRLLGECVGCSHAEACDW